MPPIPTSSNVVTRLPSTIDLSIAQLVKETSTQMVKYLNINIYVLLKTMVVSDEVYVQVKSFQRSMLWG